MNRYVTHLESALDGTHLLAGEVHTLYKDRPVWVRYDLPAIRKVLTPETLASRPHSFWRYRELLPLPLDVEPISLGESMTPLLEVPALAKQMGMRQLWFKDESILPTASFKARGLSMAVNMARHFGIDTFAIPTAGNAGGALAAYAARAGCRSYIFMPSDTPTANMHECFLSGANVFLVDGLINDCGAIVKAGKERVGWFDVSTLKEPYRIEGKKTMGLELAEQCGWVLPDVIIYPTGGGTGLIGM
ncbi:MAG: threonine synthase, partial [Phycisphaerae bacterium]